MYLGLAWKMPCLLRVIMLSRDIGGRVDKGDEMDEGDAGPEQGIS